MRRYIVHIVARSKDDKYKHIHFDEPVECYWKESVPGLVMERIDSKSLISAEGILDPNEYDEHTFSIGVATHPH